MFPKQFLPLCHVGFCFSFIIVIAIYFLPHSVTSRRLLSKVRGNRGWGGKEGISFGGVNDQCNLSKRPSKCERTASMKSNIGLDNYRLTTTLAKKIVTAEKFMRLIYSSIK